MVVGLPIVRFAGRLEFSVGSDGVEPDAVRRVGHKICDEIQQLLRGSFVFGVRLVLYRVAQCREHLRLHPPYFVGVGRGLVIGTATV